MFVSFNAYELVSFCIQFVIMSVSREVEHVNLSK